MTNVFMFRNDNGTPSGWTNYSSALEGRYVLAHTTPGNSGGSNTHTHSITNISAAAVSNSAINVGQKSGGFAYESATDSHTHSASNITSGNGNHEPSYKTFNIVYRSTSGWLGEVPSGNIGFRETVPANYSRIENGSSYFIKISATAGSVGGGGMHNHTYSGTTNSGGTQGGTLAWANGGTSYTSNQPHTHTYSGTTSSLASADWAYWSCGLIQANSNTYVANNTVLLFDGDPGASWTNLSVVSKYLRISSSNSILSGGSYSTWTHNHGNISVTSGNCNACIAITVVNFYATQRCHTHTINGTTQNSDATLAYSTLTLYKALSDFGVVSTRCYYVITC